MKRRSEFWDAHFHKSERHSLVSFIYYELMMFHECSEKYHDLSAMEDHLKVMLEDILRLSPWEDL